MIVGSVSSEVYRRIEEYVRKGAGAPDPSKLEQRCRGNDDEIRVRTKHEHRRCGAISLTLAHVARRRPASRTAPPLERPFGSARGCLPPTGTRSANSRASGSPPSSGSSTASSRSNGSRRRNIRRSRAGPRTSPFRIPSSASRASDARKSVLANSHGAAFGSPLFISRMP